MAHVYHHGEFSPERIASTREQSVSVCVPTRDEAGTIGPIVDCLVDLRDRGVVDQVVVVDNSIDGTAELAEARGAELHLQAELHPELGPVLGKGDAMWRALSVLDGDVVCFVDGDTSDFGPRFVCGLIGPLLAEPPLQLVKAFYRRPFRGPVGTADHGGGRVTELMARPLLSMFYPQLAEFRQPLAGEIAARRDLLERLRFTVGYGVDVGLLIDAWKLVGTHALAQVDLDVRQNAHKNLPDLALMSYEVLAAVTDRLRAEGRLGAVGDAPFVDASGALIDLPGQARPPHNAGAQLTAATAGANL